jgi:DNA-binding response OmpR family regulator
LLLIDDEPAQRRLITAIGARAGWWVRGANDLDAAQKMFADPQEPKFDAILLDHWLPGEEGTDFIRQLRLLKPELPLLVLTAQTSVAVAVDAMRAGASDFLVKPLAPDRLLAALDAATDRRRKSGELRPLSEKIGRTLGFEEIVGSASQFRAAMAIAAKAARARVSVLIEGESGSGKEIIAQAIHAASPRGKKQLHTVNCGHPGASRQIPFRPRGFWRLRPPYRSFRGCRRLDPVPDEVGELPLETKSAARARDRRVPAGRQPHHPGRRRAHHRRDQSPPGQVPPARFARTYYRSMYPACQSPPRRRLGQPPATRTLCFCRGCGRRRSRTPSRSDDGLAVLMSMAGPATRPRSERPDRAAVLCERRALPPISARATGAPRPSA